MTAGAKISQEHSYALRPTNWTPDRVIICDNIFNRILGIGQQQGTLKRLTLVDEPPICESIIIEDLKKRSLSVDVARRILVTSFFARANTNKPSNGMYLSMQVLDLRSSLADYHTASQSRLGFGSQMTIRTQ